MKQNLIYNSFLKSHSGIPEQDSSFNTTCLAYGWDLDGDYTRINNLGASLQYNTPYDFSTGALTAPLDSSALWVNTEGYYVVSANAGVLSCFNGPFTYSVWVKDLQTDTDYIDTFGSLTGDCSSGDIIAFRLDTYGTVRASVRTTRQSAFYTAESSLEIEGKGPYMLTATWDASTKETNLLKLYIDGSLVSQTQTYEVLGVPWIYPDPATPKAYFLNCKMYTNDVTHKALYNRVRIWPCALDADTIKWVYDTKY